MQSVPATMEVFEVWSNLFIGNPERVERGTACVEEATWERVHEEYEGSRRIFVRIRSSEAVALNEGPIPELILPLGAPISKQEGARPGRRLYLRAEELEMVGMSGSGEDAEIDWLTEEAFPEATRIVLRPHEGLVNSIDARGELEVELTRRGVLSTGDTVRVTFEALGGYEVAFDVVTTEPANRVLMEGDEVALEFEEAIDVAAERRAAEAAAAAAAERAAAAAAVAESMDSVLPVPPTTPAGGPGYRLGGQVRPPLADGRPWNPWRAQAAARP